MRLPRPYVTTWLALLAGCASSPPAPAPALAAPQVPASLSAPAGQSVYLEALARGVQIYECSQKPDATYDWVFKAPEAALTARSGQSIGKHYAGPTWESNDGSAVIGVVKSRDPGPNPTAIPWLLLAAKATTGSGTFSLTKSIQRVTTVGGQPPPAPCTAANLGQVVRVPYSATYYFYR